MRVLSIVCLVLLGSLNLTAQTGCIEGNVIDTGGVPIPFPDVLGYGRDAKTAFRAITDATGHFHIRRLRAGNYLLGTSEDFKAGVRNLAAASARATRAQSIQVVESGLCSTVTLRRPPRARIHLQATDMLTGAPIPAAELVFRFSGDTEWQKLAARQGDPAAPPLSDLEVQAQAVGYQNSETMKLGPLEPGELRELALTLRPVQLGCITGTVLGQNQVPVGGVRVRPYLHDEHLLRPGASVTTDQNGRFRLEGVQPGNYFLETEASSQGYSSLADEAIGSDSHFTVLSGGCEDVTLQLGPKAATLRIKVVDAITQEPLRAFTVKVQGEQPRHGLWTITAHDEPINVPSLKPLRIHVTAESYLASPELRATPLQPEETQELTIALRPAALQPDAGKAGR